MARFAWITDTHFNYVDNHKLFSFCESLKDFDGVFLTGDISTGKLVSNHLKILESLVRKPIYFVLGNHDRYNSDFSSVDKLIANLNVDNLKYLSNSEPIELTKSVGLVGHDGWYDSGWTTPLTWLVFIYDWKLIGDFKSSNIQNLEKTRHFAKLAADSTKTSLQNAFERFDTVYFLTHFPPWPERRGNVLDKFWNPYNSSKIMADMLIDVMKGMPNKHLVILSGHDHKHRTQIISSNITLKVGYARCGDPSISEIIVT